MGAPYGDFRALHHAVVQGQTETVARLLEAGADPSRRITGWGAALHRASYAGHPEVVRLLLDSGTDVDEIVQEDDLRTPLFFAAHGGSLAVVELLLERGADPTRLDSQSITPAGRARQFRHAAVADRLEAASAGR